jgi:hypothetical protein
MGIRSRLHLIFTLRNLQVRQFRNNYLQFVFQGFHFAYSHQGIQTMARELTMKTGTGGLSAQSTQQPCLVQVVKQVIFLVSSKFQQIILLYN